MVEPSWLVQWGDGSKPSPAHPVAHQKKLWQTEVHPPKIWWNKFWPIAWLISPWGGHLWGCWLSHDLFGQEIDLPRSRIPRYLLHSNPGASWKVMASCPAHAAFGRTNGTAGNEVSTNLLTWVCPNKYVPHKLWFQWGKTGFRGTQFLDKPIYGKINNKTYPICATLEVLSWYRNWLRCLPHLTTFYILHLLGSKPESLTSPSNWTDWCASWFQVRTARELDWPHAWGHRVVHHVEPRRAPCGMLERQVHR